MDNVREAALTKRAAVLMDRILPGWHNRVNLDRLAMSNGAQCLLGQTFGLHAEKCIVKEMYPEEFKAAAELFNEDYTDDPEYARKRLRLGYSLANDARKGGLLQTIMRKVGLYPELDLTTQGDLYALQHVCNGHDTKCHWAEEIAARRAAEEVNNGA